MATISLHWFVHRLPINKARLSTSIGHIIKRCIATRSYQKLWRLSTFGYNYGRSLTSDAQTEKFVSSPIPDVSIPNKPFAEFMFSSMKQYGDTKAMIDFQTGRSYTYAQLHDASIRLASALYKLGYRKGDTILILSTNCPEYGIINLACAAIGVIVSTCNPTYTSGELARQLEESGATSVVTLPEMVSKVREAISSNTLLSETVKQIIVIGESHGCRPFFPLLEDDGKSFPQNVDFDPQNDVFHIPFSSGTTGLPKGVMLTQANIISNILQTDSSLPMEAGKDRLLVVLPMFHIYGLVVSLYTSLFKGITLITVPNFFQHQFIDAVQKYKVTQLQVVPPLVVFLTKDPNVGRSELSSVKKVSCGSAPLGKALSLELLNKFDLQLIQGYGLTEMSPAITIDQYPARLGTAGQLVANTEGKVVDISTGIDLGANQEGEVCVRGPQLMKGYLNNEEATRNMIKDGWLYTGDIGFYDDDGYFTITDRLKELIKYKGFQVPPAELEALILTHPDVQDCGVVGVPDEEAGELPRAYVVPKPGVDINTDDVAKFVEKNVVSYKKLRGGIEIIDAIPKSPSGKILHRQLRDKIKK